MHVPARTASFSQHGLFLLVFLVLLVYFLDWTTELYSYALSSTYYSHILLVPFLSVGLLYMDRDRIFRDTEWNLLPGGLLLALGLASVAIIPELDGGLHRDTVWFFRIGSLILIGLGLFIGAYGYRAARRGRFPLLMLLFTLPLPESLASRLMLFLQWLSADLSEIFFRMSPAPVFREGYYFLLPGLLIKVADVCSGLRSFLVLIIMSLLLGYWLRLGWGRYSLLLVSVLPITILTNAVRIVTVSLMGVYIHPRWVDASHHLHSGKVTFGLALVLLFGLAWLLDRSASRSRKAG